MNAIFIDACNKGHYYYPAHEHYGRDVNVICDRCGQSNLLECVGYGDKLDLCLSCVTAINSQRNGSPQTPIMQDHISPIRLDFEFARVCDKGTYFYPAYEHYGRKTNVGCDRCKKSNLTECIGYGDKLDLCLSCVTAINRQRNNVNEHIMCFVVPSYNER